MTSNRNSAVLFAAVLAFAPAAISTLSGCEDGVDGAQGPAGPPGSAGPVGSTGATGPKGEQGDKGDPGEDGQDGQDGTDGNGGSGGSSGNNGGNDSENATLYSWDLYSGEGVYDDDLKPSNLWATVKSDFANSSGRKFYNLRSGSPPNWSLEKFSGKQGGYLIYQIGGHPVDFMLSAPNGALFGKTFYIDNGEQKTETFWGVSNITYAWSSDDRCPCYTILIAQQAFTMGGVSYAYMLPGPNGNSAAPATELSPFINQNTWQAIFNPAQKADLP